MDGTHMDGKREERRVRWIVRSGWVGGTGCWGERPRGLRKKRIINQVKRHQVRSKHTHYIVTQIIEILIIIPLYLVSSLSHNLTDY